MQTRTSRRAALLELFKSHRLDYTPATTYGVDRYSHPWMAEEPSFRRVLEQTDALDHIFALHLSYYASFGFTDILGVIQPEDVVKQVYRTADATNYHLTLHTPRGDLTARYMEKDGMHTVWRYDHLIKSTDDIDRFLSARFKPNPPDTALFQRVRNELGERGVMEIEMPDPLCLVIENMSYEDFMLGTLEYPEKIDALLDLAGELIYTWLEGLLQAGFGPVFRIFGPEYAAPPMMSPEFFERGVVERDRPLIELIHRHGCHVRYHCHGPIASIVDHMLDLQVDMTDPCEAPPNGDIGLRDLAARVGRELILMGNLQLDDLERGSPEQIERLVAEAVEEVGGRAPFILCPTAPPFESPLPSRTERNLIAFLQAAEKYGARVN